MGGGAMRAAAKLTGVTVATVGLRGISAEKLPISSSARRAGSVRPAAATLPSSDEVKLVASRSEKSFSDIDDWVHASVAEEVTVGAREPLPKVVFDGVPTLKESREATSDLAIALEKAYLSSNDSVEYEKSVSEMHESALSFSQVGNTKTSTINDIAMVPAVGSPAVKAFRLLHESSAAQQVVASIVCDPNVWNAVLQNQELQEFVQSQKTSSASLGSINYSNDVESDSGNTDSSDPGNGFFDFIKQIKITVVDMMNSLSGYFYSFFGGQEAKVSVNADGTAKFTSENMVQQSLLGLAIMAIMIILLKRA